MATATSSTTLHAGTDPVTDRAAATATPSRAGSGRSAGLISLVRNLIAFGQALLQTLQSSPAVEVFTDIARRFGTRDLKLIIARITRGLMLAAELDARLVRGASRLDAPPVRSVAVRSRHTTPRPVRASRTRAVSQDADDATLLAGLPSAQEIAARLRGKPLGVVLEEICHDLGIMPNHKLWDALNLAILGNGGRLIGLYMGAQQRLKAFMSPMNDLVFAYPRPPAALTGTGPP